MAHQQIRQGTTDFRKFVQQLFTRPARTQSGPTEPEQTRHADQRGCKAKDDDTFGQKDSHRIYRDKSVKRILDFFQARQGQRYAHPLTVEIDCDRAGASFPGKRFELRTNIDQVSPNPVELTASLTAALQFPDAQQTKAKW
ncbi:hypothetical protein PMHK_36060 [Pseudomonas sp. MHK4]